MLRTALRLLSFRLRASTDRIPRLGALIDGRVVDFSGHRALPQDMRSLIAAGDEALAAAGAFVEHASSPEKASALPRIEDVDLLAPIRNPSKIIAIGLNYSDHAEECGQPAPPEPVVFNKTINTLCGTGAPIPLPRSVKKLDWESELVIVIGARTKNVSEADAMRHVFGFTVGHDVSARDWQIGRPGGQWLLGKSFDNFGPTGPVIATRAALPDPHNLRISMSVNGTLVQNGNTNKMIYRTEQLVSFVSQVMTLEPGDLIFTGTPPGVGMGRKPEVYLKVGDVCAAEIEGIGKIENTVVDGDAFMAPPPSP